MAALPPPRPPRASAADRHPVLFAMGFGGLLGCWLVALVAGIRDGVGAALVWIVIGIVLFVGTGLVAGGIDGARNAKGGRS